MTDPETRAREFLAAEWAASGNSIDAAGLLLGAEPSEDWQIAIRAIVAALETRAIPVDVADLCERLKRVDCSGDELGGDIGTCSYRNPDGPEAATALETLAAENERLREEAKQARRECQAVWRCAIGDMVGALDVLKSRWSDSRRKADREAATVLSPILDLLWAYRDPAPANYQQAAANGLSLIDRARAALSPGTQVKDSGRG